MANTMPNSNANRDRVLAAAANLEAMIDALPRIEGPDWDASHRKYREAEDALAAELTSRSDARASIRRNFDGISISMLGFRASSTSGLGGACRNWIRQVRQKANLK